MHGELRPHCCTVLKLDGFKSNWPAPEVFYRRELESWGFVRQVARVEGRTIGRAVGIA
jgi:hypothetical protein